MKWLFYFLGFAVLLALLVIASPLIALLGVGATLYFWKKKPDASKRNISALVAIMALLASVFLLPNMLKKDELKTISPASSASPISLETSAKESAQPEVSNTESTLTESTSSSQEIKNDGPEYTNDSNALFANHLAEYIQSNLSEGGVDFTVKVESLSNDSLYVTVPQNFKYISKVEIQSMADTLYSTKKTVFTIWAIENGYDLGFISSPALFVRSEDGTILAEENILFGGMKVKVQN